MSLYNVIHCSTTFYTIIHCCTKWKGFIGVSYNIFTDIAVPYNVKWVKSDAQKWIGYTITITIIPGVILHLYIITHNAAYLVSSPRNQIRAPHTKLRWCGKRNNIPIHDSSWRKTISINKLNGQSQPSHIKGKVLFSYVAANKFLLSLKKTHVFQLRLTWFPAKKQRALPHSSIRYDASFFRSIFCQWPSNVWRVYYIYPLRHPSCPHTMGAPKRQRTLHKRWRKLDPPPS